MSSAIERDGSAVNDAALLETASHYLEFVARSPLTSTARLRETSSRLKQATRPGACLAYWVDARELQPPPGQLVTVAYLWPGDDCYTVDTAELDGDVWRYSGGDLMTSEEVHWWCHPPAVPGHAIQTHPRRDAVLAA